MAWRWMTALLILLWTVPAAAQGASPFEGRWALLAEGRVLAILELRHAAANGQWSGGLVRPDRMTITSGHQVFGISGPVVRRPVLSARSQGEDLELSIAGRDGEGPGRYLFKALDSDHAELSLDPAAAVPPIPLVRTTAQAAVEPQWGAEAHYGINTPYPTNAEMKALFDADQTDRRPRPDLGWTAVPGATKSEGRALWRC